MKKIHLSIAMSILFLWTFNPNFSIGQSAISVGSGSYAEYPPDNEYVGGDAANGTF